MTIKLLEKDRIVMLFGDYIDTQTQPYECLVLHFSSAILSPRHQWLNNSLTAKFVADYWDTLAVSCHESASEYLGYAKDVISYVANELLDNAIKYGSVSADNAMRVTIRLLLLPQHIRVYVTNNCLPYHWMSFQDYIKILLTENPETLYFRQMEANAASQEHTISRLGLLSIMHDYHGQIGWKFESPSQCCREHIVTTMVQISMIA